MNRTPKYWINIWRNNTSDEERPGSVATSLERSFALVRGPELQGHVFVRRIPVYEV